ncbi:SMR family transporter [Myxococcus sp. AB036A]|uniref:SMR family transporter n=1 Tax=Myxococcus sp. AB036A TaxID=2562793 RepID=UPI00272B90EA|nr:SMR family transporter [Myxococcus sp. AB036A]
MPSTAIVASMAPLVRSTRRLPIGTAYTVRGGIGGAAIGAVLFEETVLSLRSVFVALLVLSTINLKQLSTASLHRASGWPTSCSRGSKVAPRVLGGGCTERVSW